MAHTPPINHGCEAPIRPADKRNEKVWNHFVDKVDEFRACINAFTIANHAASDLHRERANAATDEWNQFVHDSLNAPEDYPWPPEERQGSH